MSAPPSTQDVTFQLFRIPREKEVLDYVLQKLSGHAGPGRHELIEELFSMYRTSAGFDPFALSKGRVKRMKAAEFRQLLQEVDAQIAVILSSDEYRQMTSKDAGPDQLFREYAALSDGVFRHPALSLTSELEELLQSCHTQDVPELLLLFCRQHPDFLRDVFQQEGYTAFLQRYDAAVDRERQLQQQFRLGIRLLQLEQNADRGWQDEQAALQLLQDAGQLLDAEQHPGYRCLLLLHIVRSALLTVTPARHLSGYFVLLEQNLQRLMVYRDDSGRRVLRVLATYHLAAGREKRLMWMEKAESEARKLELDEERPAFRFIRCMIEADAGHTDAALVALNDAEHLLYKTSNRSLTARNYWVRLSEYRTLLFVLKALEGDSSYSAQLPLLQQLAEEMGRHRHEITVMTGEWKALQLVLTGDYADASALFEKAKQFRKDTPTHPWRLLDVFFMHLLSKTRKKGAAAQAALELEQLKEPFYSGVMSAIMKQGAAILLHEPEKQE